MILELIPEAALIPVVAGNREDSNILLEQIMVSMC